MRLVLWRISKTTGFTSTRNRSVDRDKLSVKKGTLKVEIPANRIDRAPVGATKGWSVTGRRLQGAIELRQRMGPSGAWGDALRLEPTVCRKGLEQSNNPLEECNSLSARGAAGREARRLQCAVASSMGGPLVLPESFVTFVVADPVFLHERQGGTSALRVQQVSNVRVITARITVFGIGAIAVVWPETVYSPAIAGTRRRMRVPELCLSQQSSWRLVTAKIRRRRVCGAGYRPIRTAT